MSRGRRYSAEQIVWKHPEAEVEPSKGRTAVQAARNIRHIGVTEQMYDQWRKEYGVLPMADRILSSFTQDDCMLRCFLGKSPRCQ